LGHAQISMTLETYAHATPDLQADAAVKLRAGCYRSPTHETDETVGDEGSAKEAQSPIKPDETQQTGSAGQLETHN
jgi:hypothetical protein